MVITACANENDPSKGNTIAQTVFQDREYARCRPAPASLRPWLDETDLSTDDMVFWARRAMEHLPFQGKAFLCVFVSPRSFHHLAWHPGEPVSWNSVPL